MATYQSLYRRYRPQRFDEVLGQGHVTRALRNAVRDGRVGHAYLFSGPRGTGKTSTARILAKVLNCAAPVDGEPCGTCESCVAVAEGRVTDWLLEQDAASKSKVDDMRDLIDRVPLGTSGNRKVIILDEVHMLSQGAENALLKTLEEPPAHVVFVLATTDPQKVRPTIRSRTQHFEFRLLPPDVLADHVRHIIGDAALGLDAADVDGAVEHVIRSGGGSARDTLSALDQVAALGEVVDERQPVDAILDALCDRDAGQVLVAVADALASGRDPRTLGENVIAGLRDAFLAVMGAADVHLAPAERDRAARVGEQMGAPGLTRALDVLGEALTELSRKPDPRVVVEVALVRITQPSTDRTLDAVLERLDRLERAAASGSLPAAPQVPTSPASAPASASPTVPTGPAGAGGSTTPPGPSAGGPPATAPRGVAPTPDPAPEATDSRGGPGGPGAAAARDALSSARGPRSTAGSVDPTDAAAPTGRSAGATLGSVTRGRRGTGKAKGAVDAPSDSVAAPPPEAAVDAGPVTTPDQGSGQATDAIPPPADPGAGEATGATPTAVPGAPGDLPAPAEVDAAWSGGVLAGLPVKIRSKWRGGHWAPPGEGELRFAVPNEWHQKACDGFRREVEQALAAHLGRPVSIAVIVDGDAGPSASSASSAPGAAGAPAPSPSPSPSSGPPEDDENIDPSELRDADNVATNGVDLLLREFGGELVEEEP